MITALAILAFVVAVLALALAVGQSIRGGQAVEDAERAARQAALAHMALVPIVQRLDDIGVLQNEHLRTYLTAARDVLGPDQWAELTGERDT